MGSSPTFGTTSFEADGNDGSECRRGHCQGVNLSEPGAPGSTLARRAGPGPLIGFRAGSLIYFCAAAVGAVLVSDWGEGTAEMLVWVARALLVVAGLIVAIGSLARPPRRNVLMALTVPLPTLVPGFLVIAGLSESRSDLPEAVRIVAIAYVLFVVPILAVVGLRHAINRQPSPGG